MIDIFIMMDQCMMGNGNQISKMDLVFFILKIRINMKDNVNLIKTRD